MFKSRLQRKWVLAKRLSERTFRGEHEALGGAAVIFTTYALSVPGAFLFLVFPALSLPIGSGDLWAWIALTLVWLFVG